MLLSIKLKLSKKGLASRSEAEGGRVHHPQCMHCTRRHPLHWKSKFENLKQIPRAKGVRDENTQKHKNPSKTILFLSLSLKSALLE